jgi:hypothetical protein
MSTDRYWQLGVGIWDENTFSARDRLGSSRSDYSRFTRTPQDLSKKCQEVITSLLGSRLQMKTVSPPGVTSIAAESNFRELLENGAI